MVGNFPENKDISSAEYRLVRGVIDFKDSVRLVKVNEARINIRKNIRIVGNNQFLEVKNSLFLADLNCKDIGRLLAMDENSG